MLSTKSNGAQAGNVNKESPPPKDPAMLMENYTEENDKPNNIDESEFKSEMDMPADDGNDPLACIKSVIKWKGEIGYLPGSVCQFKLDSRGDLLLVDDDCEEEPFRKRQKFLDDNIASDELLNDEVSRCKNCNRHGFKQEFLKNGTYCKDCANLNPLYFKMVKHLSVLYDPKGNNKANSNLNMDVHQQILQPLPLSSSSNSNHTSKTFSWDVYLEKSNAVAIPDRLFLPTQLIPANENLFEVGMKLEGIDPFHPSRFCVLTVTEIQGFRIRLHFDGYKRKYDFWVNSNNEFIFPAGFCKSTHRMIEPPKGLKLLDSFNWDEYLLLTDSQAAPSNCFAVPKEDDRKIANVVAMGFNVGMKLEAVDKANNALICVASIKDILNEYLLIHFDGWDDSYDYWAHYNSPLIHPVYWCKSKGKPLTAPKDYKSDPFVWDEYLNETDTIAVPQRAFKSKPANSWKTGMKLEAMDCRNPRVIRVATVVNRSNHVVKIHFDGWDDKYDYWIDDDCPNLHPIKWCSQTMHPLQPPPEYGSKLKKCTISQCNGLGHVRWYNHKRHVKEEDCPYHENNMDNEPSDRHEISNESDESDEEQGEETEEEEEEEEVTEEHDQEVINESEVIYEQIENIDGENTLIGSEWRVSFVNCSYFIMEKDQQALTPAVPSYLLEKYRQLLEENALGVGPDDVVSWDYAQVEQFVHKLTECQHTSQIFADQRIDGQSLLMLQQDDLSGRLRLKLGPTVKIYSFIAAIRASLLDDQQ